MPRNNSDRGLRRWSWHLKSGFTGCRRTRVGSIRSRSSSAKCSATSSPRTIFRVRWPWRSSSRPILMNSIGIRNPFSGHTRKPNCSPSSGHHSQRNSLRNSRGQYLVAASPHLAEIASIGKSLEGRDLWLVTLTNKQTGPALEKPAYWIDGNTHAGEVTGSTVVLYTLWSYLTHYGRDTALTRILDRCAIYLLPRLSVDGAERYLTTPYSLRSSPRLYPYAEERDGLYPEDINGDGLILQMRLKDPNGAWKCADKDARIMRRREIDEEGGTYYHLLTEGLIRNYDGYSIPVAPPRQGLDINRNYAFAWAPEGTQRGAGPYPFSEPETRAQAEFWRTHPNISGFLTYHTSAGVLLRPYSTQSDDAMPSEDLDVFTLLGQRGTQLTGYPCVSTYHGFRYGPHEVTHG